MYHLTPRVYSIWVRYRCIVGHEKGRTGCILYSTGQGAGGAGCRTRNNLCITGCGACITSVSLSCVCGEQGCHWASSPSPFPPGRADLQLAGCLSSNYLLACPEKHFTPFSFLSNGALDSSISPSFFSPRWDPGFVCLSLVLFSQLGPWIPSFYSSR
jgi:hypothetical protein